MRVKEVFRWVGKRPGEAVESFRRHPGTVVLAIGVISIAGAAGLAYRVTRQGNAELVEPATPTPSEAAGTSPNVISDDKGDARVIMEPDGRIWQDNIRVGNVPYRVSFTMPTNAGDMTRRFRGINAQLLEDTDKNGEPDKLVAGGVNDKEVTMTPGGWYKVEGGANNGGFSLEIPANR